MGEHFFELLADLTSCGAALFGAFGGFNVLWGSAFWVFRRISRSVGEHFFEHNGGFHVLWARTILSFWSFLAEIDVFEDVLK